MLRALVAIGLLGAAQAWINSQTRARRERLAGTSNPSLQNWEDEGGAVVGGPQLASQYGGSGGSGGSVSKDSTPSLGAQPSLAKMG